MTRLVVVIMRMDTWIEGIFGYVNYDICVLVLYMHIHLYAYICIYICTYIYIHIYFRSNRSSGDMSSFDDTISKNNILEKSRRVSNESIYIDGWSSVSTNGNDSYSPVTVRSPVPWRNPPTLLPRGTVIYVYRDFCTSVLYMYWYICMNNYISIYSCMNIFIHKNPTYLLSRGLH
jgi:hypothetical protein